MIHTLRLHMHSWNSVDRASNVVAVATRGRVALLTMYMYTLHMPFTTAYGAFLAANYVFSFAVHDASSGRYVHRTAALHKASERS
jgi:hypothetical protein